MAGKCFQTNVQQRKWIFVAAVNNFLANGADLSEQCLLELNTKHCVPILTYGCCNWSISNEYKR